MSLKPSSSFSTYKYSKKLLLGGVSLILAISLLTKSASYIFLVDTKNLPISRPEYQSPLNTDRGFFLAYLLKPTIAYADDGTTPTKDKPFTLSLIETLSDFFRSLITKPTETTPTPVKEEAVFNTIIQPRKETTDTPEVPNKTAPALPQPFPEETIVYRQAPTTGGIDPSVLQRLSFLESEYFILKNSPVGSSNTIQYITYSGGGGSYSVPPAAVTPTFNTTTGTAGVTQGGTGLSTPPTLGQVLLGNSSGGFDLTSTSSLGISVDVNTLSPIEVGFANVATSTYASAFGYCNTASGNKSSASGYHNNTYSNYASAFGMCNNACGNGSSAFGYINTASGNYSSALGRINTASGTYSSASGYNNTASGCFGSSFGYKNTASTLNSSVFGRSNFTSTGGLGSVVVGLLNNSTGATLTNATGAITGAPSAAGTVGYSTTAVGVCNVTSGNFGSAVGYNNTVSGSNGTASGYCNTASGVSSSAFGYCNTSSGYMSTAIGKNSSACCDFSSAFGYLNVASSRSSSALGVRNTASCCKSSASGYFNTASGDCSSAFGYSNTASAAFSSAFGNSLTNSTANSAMLGSGAGWIRVKSDKSIETAISGACLSVGGAWTSVSNRDVKENFTDVNSDDVLSKINSLNIQQWNYKAEDASITHIGPVAQDFYAAFQLGGSDKSISSIDPAGVALLGIQALSKRLDALQSTSTPSFFSSLSLELASTTPGEASSWTDIFKALQYFGAEIVDGVAYLKNVFVEKLTVGSPEKPTGINIFDKKGQPGCITIEDVNYGTIKVTPGNCDDLVVAPVVGGSPSLIEVTPPTEIGTSTPTTEEPSEETSTPPEDTPVDVVSDTETPPLEVVPVEPAPVDPAPSGDSGV